MYEQTDSDKRLGTNNRNRGKLFSSESSVLILFSGIYIVPKGIFPINNSQNPVFTVINP